MSRTCFSTGVMIDDCLLKINPGYQSCISLFSESGAVDEQRRGALCTEMVFNFVYHSFIMPVHLHM